MRDTLVKERRLTPACNSREITASGAAGLLRRLPVVGYFLCVLVGLSNDLRADSSFAPASPHPAVVRVAAPESDGAAYGSGALVAVNESSGLVLTNWHVVRDAAGPIVVYFPDGFHSVAYLLRTDRDWDLAALAIRRPNVQPIPLAAQAPRPGDLLTIAGYGSGAYRTATGQCTQYLSPGAQLPFEILELSAPARNGDSGGPIFNSRGQLAGILFGSAFGRTSGSYCGRLRWFLALVDADFRRISAQALLAQQSRRQAPQTAAISASPLQTREEQGVRAVATQTASQPQMLPAPLVPVTLPNGQPSVAPATIVPTPPANVPSTTDQVKTILAAIGAIAVLYHVLRLLGKAVG